MGQVTHMMREKLKKAYEQNGSLPVATLKVFGVIFKKLLVVDNGILPKTW